MTEPPGIAVERQEKADGRETDDLRIRVRRLEELTRKTSRREKKHGRIR